MSSTNTSQGANTASTLPTIPPRPQSQANRGRKRTRSLKSNTQITSQNQGNDFPSAGLYRVGSAPAVRANSSKRRARSSSRSLATFQRPRTPRVPNTEDVTASVFPELETEIGSGSSSPMSLLFAPNTPRARSSQPSQLALCPVRSETQRGRTQRRATPLPQTDHIPETPPSQRPASRSRGRPITPKSPSRARSRSQRTILGELPIANTANQGVRRTDSVRVVKGGFVIKTPLTEQYKHPKPSNQPEPVWRAGDGFSEDEAAPNFLFYVTGTRKRRRSLTLPGMGKLPTGMEETESPSIRPSNKRSRGIGVYENIELLRGGQKEPWPTKTDFEDCTLPTRPERSLQTLQKDHAAVVIPATFRPQREQSVASGSTIKYIPRHQKGPLDFANFRGLENVKSTYPQDDLLSRIQIRRDNSDSDSEDGEDMSKEDDNEPLMYEDSQVEDDLEGHPVSYCSTREPSPSGAYWDKDGNHVFPGDETYSEYESDWEDD